ncbi:hypothetical protein FISHEDRAFT_39094 [Fistulina hepatica ATCC 64428]|uniref:Lethal giant larvae (Lgl)-like C-terminal domain-containing protein n=1 Tax=Fistulina hepatica ATCC 64428 TaxID=1128425 RepID=A0A0D7AJB8_9AGAR|nr:hypothetical protein FISHEDRAFT_39094 [Fistulina hepatica ATCC 64428]
MFLRKDRDDHFMDLSLDLRDGPDWMPGNLKTFEYPVDISAFAIEPISRLLAVGTSSGVIHLYGGPAVEIKLLLPDSVPVKFLQFSVNTYDIVCIDDNSHLHVWELGTTDFPKLVASVRFYGRVNCLTLSPSHSHAFITLQSGEIQTYDLACLRKSPFSIPNLWTLYEQKSAASGLSELAVTPDAKVPIDTIIHPRDLNSMFIVFGGGVILCDISARNILRAYEFILSPGAPGGAGYGAHDILHHRRPAVTALAIHPAGHFFAVGYVDGSIAFWAVEDEENPLLVRTLDTDDVHLADPVKLEAHMALTVSGESGTKEDREPIFKLTWSGFANSTDPRGGATALTILGGSSAPGSQSAGLVTLQFPPFNPVEAPKESGTLDPIIRNAMKESLTPIKSHDYITSNIVQDFLLIPRDNPHLSGSFDPEAVLMLIEGLGDTRVVEAYEFPPPSFMESHRLAQVDAECKSDEDKKDQTTTEMLAATLDEMTIVEEPHRLQIPLPLNHAAAGLLGGRLYQIEASSLSTLVEGSDTYPYSLRLRGGVAWCDELEANERTHNKYQAHRLLVAYHKDYTIQFEDMSPQLLLPASGMPLSRSFPNPLPHLTINLGPLIVDSSVFSKLSPAFRENSRISGVDFALESLECAIAFQSGEIAVAQHVSPQSRSPRSMHHAHDDPEILTLRSVFPSSGRFKPYFMLKALGGKCTAFALSDIGFLSAAYSDGSLIIIDMREPTVILRHNVSDKGKRRHSVIVHTPDAFMALKWTVSPLEKDPRLGIRLVTVKTSGELEVFTLVKGQAQAWSIRRTKGEDTVANPFHGGLFLVDSKTGNPCKANRSGLNRALNSEPAESHSILVVAGNKGVRCFSDITGDRLGKAEWGTKSGVVRSAQIIERLGSHALVAFTDQHQALVYSIPHLECIKTLPLTTVSSRATIADETGDYMSWLHNPPLETIHKSAYATLFAGRRINTLADIDFLATRPTVPAQPQPVSVGPPSLLGSWLPFNQGMSGDQLDAILAGPDRPPRREKPKKLAASSGANTDNDGITAASVVAAAQEAPSSLYDRLTGALEERGNALNDLEQQFDALGEGSRNLVAQAKKMAATQSAKMGWFGM